MDETVAFADCRCTAATAKAILVSCPEWDEPIWFPQSQVHDDSEVYQVGDTGTLIVSAWIAQQKDIHEE